MNEQKEIDTTQETTEKFYKNKNIAKKVFNVAMWAFFFMIGFGFFAIATKTSTFITNSFISNTFLILSCLSGFVLIVSYYLYIWLLFKK